MAGYSGMRRTHTHTHTHTHTPLPLPGGASPPPPTAAPSVDPPGCDAVSAPATTAGRRRTVAIPGVRTVQRGEAWRSQAAGTRCALVAAAKRGLSQLCYHHHHHHQLPRPAAVQPVFGQPLGHAALSRLALAWMVQACQALWPHQTLAAVEVQPLGAWTPRLHLRGASCVPLPLGHWTQAWGRLVGPAIAPQRHPHPCQAQRRWQVRQKHACHRHRRLGWCRGRQVACRAKWKYWPTAAPALAFAERQG